MTAVANIHQDNIKDKYIRCTEKYIHVMNKKKYIYNQLKECLLKQFAKRTGYWTSVALGLIYSGTNKVTYNRTREVLYMYSNRPSFLGSLSL